MKPGILILILFSIWLVTACDGLGEGHNLPPERPAGTINGRVVDGAIANSNINVYSFENGQISELLGSAVSDADGNWQMELRVRNQPLLVEATGGEYIEETSGTRVSLNDGQFLRSIGFYDSGQIDVNITPFTHIAAALAEFKISQGIDVDQAVEEAKEEVSRLFGFDVVQTNPLDITDPANASNELSDAHLYGLFLSALSNFTNWASEQNGEAPHTTYTTIQFAQLLYNDAGSDGLLDGKGSNEAGDVIDLGIGVIPIDTITYRTTLAQHLLAVAGSDLNRTTLDAEAVFPSAARLADSSHGIFGGEPPSQSGGTPIFDIVPGLNFSEGISAFGTLFFSVDITGQASIAEIEFDIDDVVQTDPVEIENPILEINVSQFQDGDHWIGVRATDMLGVSLYKQFKINFTNISPLATVTSETITNQQTYTATGTSDNSNINIASINIQENEATLFPDGTWTAPVALENGTNILNVVITDDTSALYQTQVRVDLDMTAPVIDLSGGHSNALFSLGNNQTELRPLQNTNTDQPLFIINNQVTLGNTLITRAALNDAGIPFFAFTADDPASNGVYTASDALVTRIQYKKNNVESDWQTLVPAVNEFLVPLASETLSPDWHQSTPTDEHFVRIEVSDEAGNKTETMFSFRADIRVTPFTIDTLSTLNENLFQNTEFKDRSRLHNREFASNGYTFHNSGQAMFVSMSDDNSHLAEQQVDELVREHDVRLLTGVQWRAGFVSSALSECPRRGSWQIIDEIYNFTGGEWVLEKTPAPSAGETESVDSDTPQAPAPSDWIDKADFDNEFASFGPLTISGSTWIFNYDYLQQPPGPSSSPIPNPAFITGWTRVDSNGNRVVNCDPVRFFQEREFSSYESVRGPENIGSSFMANQAFSTSNYEVIDHGPGVCPVDALPSGDAIAASGIWFRIPANRCATIRKLVTTPDLTVYDDTEVASPDSFTSYTPKRLDQSITWTVNQAVSVNAVHDAGEENLSHMSATKVDAGLGGTSTYQVSR